MSAPTEDVLDLVELIFKMVDGPIRAMSEYGRKENGIRDPVDAINELNVRFRQHGVGFEFSNSQIMRIDSQFIHAEAVKPALALLHDAGAGFAGPLEEFLEAHEKYRKGEEKDAILAAGKSFESIMKAICTARNWTFDPLKDTANDLIRIIFDNGLIPNWMQAQFTSLRAVIASGVPTVRNKTSGHGQGATPITVPSHFVRYVLHLTASNIVFMIDSHKAMA